MINQKGLLSSLTKYCKVDNNPELILLTLRTILAYL